MLSSVAVITYVAVFSASLGAGRAAVPPSQNQAQPVHSGCYEFLMKQDECVASSASGNCRPKVTGGAVQQFVSTGTPSPPYSPFGGQRSAVLRRQSNGTASNGTGMIEAPTPAVSRAIGGLCGQYDSKEAMGVCLWAGPDAATTSPSGQVSGWMGVALTENCGKEVLLQRSDSPEMPIKAKVLDGCNFGTSQPSFGCTQVFLSQKAFMAMKPSTEELANGYLKGSITWDFASRSDNAQMPF